MKDTHLYQRLSNYNSFRSLLNVINTESIDVIKEVFANITREANNHPKYTAIKEAYVKRVGKTSAAVD